MPTPDPIYDLLIGFRLSAALRAALEVGVFNAMARGKKTPRGIASDTGASERGVRILLDALLITRLVRKDGGSYKLTNMAEEHLVEGAPGYVGHAALLHTHPHIWSAFGSLTEAVQKGGSEREHEHHFWGEFATLTSEAARESVANVLQVLRISPRSSPMLVLDLACGSGIYGRAIAETNPGAEVTMFDQPNVIKHTKKFVKDSPAAERINFLEGDVFKSDIGNSYDLVIISQLLHHFNMESCERILKKVSKAMDPGAKLAIQEFIVDDDRVRRRRQLGFSLALLAISREGEAYSFGEMRRMLVKNRFRNVQFHALGQPAQIVTASK